MWEIDTVVFWAVQRSIQPPVNIWGTGLRITDGELELPRLPAMKVTLLLCCEASELVAVVDGIDE
jgi:hypothetical protein